MKKCENVGKKIENAKKNYTCKQGYKLNANEKWKILESLVDIGLKQKQPHY